MRIVVLTLAMTATVAACSLDWGALDPRGDATSTASSSVATTSSAVGTGGTGGTSGTGGSGGVAVTPWFDPGLSRRRALTVGGVNAALADFPVLVVLDPTRIDYSLTDTGGSDLRFEAGGAVLAHDIDHWEVDGVSTVWVRVPNVEAGRTITMYYGGTPASAAVAADETWSADYLAVWHLDGDANDASGHGFDGMPADVTAVPGLVGLAYDFDLTEDSRIIVTGSSATSTAFIDGATVSAIVRARSLGDEGKARILDRTNNTTFNGGWAFMLSDVNPNCFAWGHDYDTDFGYWLSPNNSLTLNAWQHIAVTADATDQTVVFYREGSAVMAETWQAGDMVPETNSTFTAAIGGRFNGNNRTFDGIIDELRLSMVERSAAWLQAEAQAARDELLTYGDEETGPP